MAVGLKLHVGGDREKLPKKSSVALNNDEQTQGLRKLLPIFPVALLSPPLLLGVHHSFQQRQ